MLQKSIIIAAICTTVYASQSTIGTDKCSVSQISNVGKEFVFGLIYCQWSPTITISIVSETPGNLWVRAPAVGIDSHYRAQAGTREITIPTQIMQTTNDSIENKAIHIVSDTNIAVNVIMSASLWHEGFLALPIHETAKEFVVATTIAPGTKLQPAEFLIASTKNGTQIAITFPKNNTITLTLNMHQTYQFQAMYDLSGTYIRSSAPISVTAGNAYSWFSPHAVYGSFFAEQMPSTDFSGSHFIIPSLIGRAKFFVKIVTSKDHSLITLRNSTNTYNLVVTRGHPLRLENTNGVIYITSDQPCLVAVFSWDHAIEVSGGGGEFMWVVPSISNYMMSYDFVIPTSQTAFSSHLFIISPTSNVSDIYLDSAPLAPSSRSTIQTNEGGFTTMSQKISTGKHTVTSRSGSTSFGALLFGENGGRGYGFPLGMKGASKECSQMTPTATTSQSTSAHSTRQPISNGTGPYCFNCPEVSHLYLCNKVTRCQSSEICETLRTTRDAKPVDCVECCGSNFCNSHGCDGQGLPDRHNRGPLCYDCPHVESVEECDTVTLCHHGQLCSIQELEWGDVYKHFNMGCASHQCIPTKRSAPVCQNCCNYDFCNNNCTRTPPGPIIG